MAAPKEITHAYLEVENGVVVGFMADMGGSLLKKFAADAVKAGNDLRRVTVVEACTARLGGPWPLPEDAGA